MAALSLPAAILDNLIPGTENEVTQDGDRKRKGRHLAPPSQRGSKTRPILLMELRLSCSSPSICLQCVESRTTIVNLYDLGERLIYGT